MPQTRLLGAGTVAQLHDEDRAIIRAVIDGIALRHQARRLATAN